ncbi:jg25746 [Pararge aegeria aegeria]|uniref:Jg25746 protein n=1 Tax=Pararge aegeria aegeria TaxID=348720 RepID=A0A8S4QLF3_9NEOP|nr:jg25746 [Pararge aegeria aegeria]
MASGESLGAASSKRPRIVDCGTPYKRRMSSSGRPSVEMMMMIIKRNKRTAQLMETIGLSTEQHIAGHARNMSKMPSYLQQPET